MKSSDKPSLLTLPESLKQQLLAFRSRVWGTKLAEAIGFAVLSVLAALLAVFIVDRFVDTSPLVRALVLFAMLAAMLVVPYAIYRWVWRNRRLDQLARLLSKREPNIGDQLLGVIELADSDTEQARSRTLCAAAIEQVAGTAKKRDLNEAAPRHWVVPVGAFVGFAALIAIGLTVWSSAAVGNAWARLISPFGDTPRYTFTSVMPIEDSMIVPHGESVDWKVRLDWESRWTPETASIQLPGYPEQVVEMKHFKSGNEYQFQLPPSTVPSEMLVRVGDFYQTVKLDPQFRPELVAADATIQLPEYLEITEPVFRDVRSGTLSVIEGGKAKVKATASRDLANASINEENVDVTQASFSSDEVAVVERDSRLKLKWRDRDGLEGKEPFELSLKPTPDETPSVVAQDLPRQAVLLDSEQLNFQVMTADDYGIKRVGLEWKGLDDTLQKPAAGERVLANGEPERSSMQLPATFSAKSFGIEPQPIELRLWVEDYKPGRKRSYSSPHIFFVLTPDQHAIWITDQMSKWHRAALDVRDKELGLHERNKQLRQMTAQELEDDAMRDEIRKQARNEAANGRRLSGLSKQGKALLRQAARNPELGVGHLEKWAEMLQILEDISDNRMPSVAELLDQASKAKKLARGGQNKPKKSAPQAGKNRDSAGGSGQQDDDDEEKKDTPTIPSIVDKESSQQPPDKNKDDKPGPKQPESKPRLTLPNTTIAGPKKSGDDEDQEQPEAPMDDAIEEQKDLLAEFEKVADELNQLLANLEGSTLVKRLKAMSREQNQIAERIGERIDSVFGDRSPDEKEDREALAALSDVESGTTQKVSYIMDDMQSYFERRKMAQFKVVLDEMRESDVIEALTTLSKDIPKEQGMSIAQAEFWSDSFDRWADDLVEPASGGM